MKPGAATERLRPTDYRLIALCIVVCAASLFVGMRYFYKAFPEASIDFRVTKETSLPIAQAFLAQQEIPTSGYRHASSFRYDEDAKVFIERELGLTRANTLMANDVKVWRWGHRWFKPLQKEEISVEVTPHGELAGFLHTVAEDAPGPDLSSDAARSLAESFIELTLKRQVENLEYVDSQSQKRPYRTDHVFVWKVPGLDLGGATYRIAVTVQGDRVDGCSEFLKVPEEWSRNYARLRSLNEGAAQVDVLFFALLGIAMLVTLLRRIRSHDVRWKTAFIFGAVACVLQFLASLNEYPVALYDFDTTGTYASFAARVVLFGALGALSYGGIICILTACAEPLYRAANPSRLSISRMLTWGAIRTRSFLIASIVGVTLTFFFFAYEIGFYLLANRFGAWAPAEIPYTELLNTRFPWVFVLLGGFFPAVSEEWVFRAFSIPYLARLLRHRWVAVILASFIWGFGHANYPNQPFFIRGLEVGVVGLILSWAMLRFGIIAPLIAHYSIDAFYSAFLLLRSGNPYLVSTGAATAGINLVPLLVAAVAYIATRRFRPEAPVLNATEEMPAPVSTEGGESQYPPAPAYSPLSRWRAVMAFVLLAAGTVLMFMRAPGFGDFVQFRTSARKAEEASRTFLANLQFRLEGFAAATQPVVRVDDTASQYVYRAGGIEALNRLYGTQSHGAAWQTRFFRPLQKEEFRVNTDPSTARVVSFARELPEDAPGADLDTEKAKEIASSFLVRQGYNLSQFELKETLSERPVERRDSDFTWQARSGAPGAIGEARLRVRAGVLGDRIGLWTDYINTPEEWNRSREGQGAYALVAGSMQVIFVTALFAYAVLTLARGTRTGLVRWRLAAKIALAAAGLQVLDAANSIPRYRFAYDTAVSMQTAAVSAVIESLLVALGIGLAAALAVGLVTACYPQSPTLLRRDSRERWSYDAALAATASLGVLMILHWTVGRIQFHGSRLALVPPLSSPQNIGNVFPLLSSARDVFLAALLFTAIVAFAVYLWHTLQRPWPKLLLITGLLGSFLPAHAKRLSEAALDVIPSILLVTFVTLLVVVFLRGNYLAYVASAVCVAAARSSSALLGQGNTSLTVQGSLIWIAVLAWLVTMVLRLPRPAER